MCGAKVRLIALLFLGGVGTPGARAGMVVVSEFLYCPSANQPEYFVLQNLTATPLDLANWKVTQGVHFEFPSFSASRPDETLLKAHERIVLSSHDGIATRAGYGMPAGLRVFGPWTGKLANEGERITVTDKNGTIVCSVKYGVKDPWPTAADGNHRSIRLLDPDHCLDDARNWIVSSSAPPGPDGHSAGSSIKTEQAPRAPDIIINEVMFDPPSGWEGCEYVELYNRGLKDADLSGWSFRDGIQCHFPAGTTISAQGFLVIARQAARMRAVYGDIPIAGEFTGRLRGEGESIRLVDQRANTITQLTYGAGGDWPEHTRGGGSSLELIHPKMDGRYPSAWAASDETQKSSPQRYTVTGVYRELGPLGESSDHRELRLFLAQRGHVVVENIALLAGSTNLLATSTTLSTNGSAASGWLCQGTHAGSFLSNGQLHIVADGHGDDRANRVEIDAPGLRPGLRCELRFDARWVSGAPRLMAETWDGSLSHSFRLELPRRLGTPGRLNSRAMPTPPPQLDDLRHSPAVPRTTDAVRITARIASIAPLQEVVLFHRPDSFAGNVPWRTTPMKNNGAGGAKDIFSAQLAEYETNGLVVQFFVRVVTTSGLVAQLPRSGAEAPALYVVDDREPTGGLRNVRLIVPSHALDALTNGNTPRHGFRYPRLSGHYFDATAILGGDEIVYGANVRQAGSPVTRDETLQKLKLSLPDSRPFRGRTKFVYDDDAAEGRAYHDRVTRYLLYQLGAPANQNEFVRLIVNAGPSVVREEVEPVDNSFLDRNFADGRRGDLYRIDDEWRFLDNWEGVNRDAEWTGHDRRETGGYRRSWRKRTRESEDDDQRLLGLFKAVAATNAPSQNLDEFLDATATLKVAAVRGYIGDWDSFTMQRGHNAYLYRPPDEGRFQLLHWDSDEGFITGQPFYGDRVKAWLEQPRNKRIFFGYLLELVNLCSREPARLQAWLAAEREAVGHFVVQANYLNFFKAREADVMDAIAGKHRIPFTVEITRGGITSSNAVPVQLAGRAPYGVSAIHVEGHPEAIVRWDTDVEWSSELRPPLMEAEWIVRGVDRAGVVLHERRVPLRPKQ